MLYEFLCGQRPFSDGSQAAGKARKAADAMLGQMRLRDGWTREAGAFLGALGWGCLPTAILYVYCLRASEGELIW